MTYSFFDQLSEAHQTDVIWEEGVFLARRTQGYYSIILFQIEGFYTEVFYHSHFNVIIKIESFSDTDRLEPYLDSIQLHALLNT